MLLTTERLKLREFTADDFASVHAFASDPRSSTFMDWGPNSEAETRDFLRFASAAATTTPRTGHLLAIQLLEGTLIGTIGLTLTPRGRNQVWDEGEIGFTLHPDHWGRGYASEAARALRDFGFWQLSLARITATCRPENTGSAAVLLKLGMVQTGRIKNDRLIRGAWLDSLVFAVNKPNLT
ncbi:GNAT family N-acetyltransferase [Arthrobacter cryoconiti]|uniref:GNAT family N-acetyltransferase n=1 Tax=Arthrobacter cryoconiti TaxID=748907 RepID=A0ABV8R1E6_9MICC|nr:GNAT family N-acetyltransferase [Arthrobacter cryoconiti]MCC9069790.1 GNAT family N-acetyltransferase [Arthrobacter cryoconiti]